MRPLLITFCFLIVASKSFSQQSKSPKLVVGIVIDQMCYEYLYRYYDKFCDNGFRKLMVEGTNCRNTQYNYVPTYTGPGHASIYTGTTPSNHGIVANDWFESESGNLINCVDDKSVSSVGSNSIEGECSPVNLKSYTVTDQLKLTYPKAKVISMSIKDRGAILPGGHLSNGSYWFDYSVGKFITSTFFMDDLPKWVKEFNEKEYPRKSMNETWSTLLDISAYAESGPDDSPYEVLLPGKSSPTFPYNLKEMSGTTPDYSIFTSTPFANTYLTDFALASLSNENLGKDEQTDVLCISFSSTDIAGHAFGPYSVELEDMYIRLDLELARLIKELELNVGKDEFTMFITADHAVVPVPQYLMDKKLPGGYVYEKKAIEVLKQDILKEFGHQLILEVENNNVYLDNKLINDNKLNKSIIEKRICDAISTWKGVKAIYTADELMDGASNDIWEEMVSLGYNSKESGDIIFLLEPGYLPKSEDTEKSHKGTSHGSAFNYDSHVPLLWYGKGIPQQEIFRRINITDIAATLTHILYLQRTGAMTGEPILEILGK